MREFFGAILLVFLLQAQCVAADMTISGAASLTNAFTELARKFEKANPGLAVHTNFAASNPLLRQLVEGAPVDVFATADQETMDKAAEAKVIDPTTRKTFAMNDLVLIVPKGSAKPAMVTDLKQMARIAIGNPASVPAGRYTKAALTEAKLWDDLSGKFILANSVRQALDYVARGEVEAGFVYATDARQFANEVDVALVVDGHDPVSYPVAIAVNGANPEAGKKFIELLLSPEGQKVLAEFGFSKP